MKKLFLIYSFVGLLAAVSCLPAAAQVTENYETRIPFDFNIGQKSYQAGDYEIKLARTATNVTAFSLTDNNGKVLHTILVMDNGEVSKKQVELVFDHHDGQRFLAKLLTRQKGFALYQTKAERNLAGKKRQKGAKT